MAYETIIGLEIHIKLNSPNKLFCRCENIQEFDELEPNTHICPVCTGQPGALPALNREPLDLALKLGLALGCEINEISGFDRKSYFYPDLPMGYQITQQRKPTCVDGEVHFFTDDEYTKEHAVRIRDAHIETDTGKSVASGDRVWLDYNRSGTPLVEIVTYPDFRSADEVVAFLKELQRIARYNQISSADMEKGQLRVDVNISLRKEGEQAYNTRVEMKNMNSFSAVRHAIKHEYERQYAIYVAGGEPDQETRGWDESSGKSYCMRSKEDAMDYRYMPEPDLPPLEVEGHQLDELRADHIYIPFEIIRTYKETYNFNKEFVNGLIGEHVIHNYFERCLSDGHEPKLTAKWIVGQIARYLNENIDADELSKLDSLDTTLPFDYKKFTKFLQLQEDGELSNAHAKIVMKEMIEQGTDPETVIEEQGLKPVSHEQVESRVEEVLDEHPAAHEDIKAGNMKPIGFLIGQTIQKSEGAADPKMVKEIVLAKAKH